MYSSISVTTVTVMLGLTRSCKCWWVNVSVVMALSMPVLDEQYKDCKVDAVRCSALFSPCMTCNPAVWVCGCVKAYQTRYLLEYMTVLPTIVLLCCR